MVFFKERKPKTENIILKQFKGPLSKDHRGIKLAVLFTGCFGCFGNRMFGFAPEEVLKTLKQQAVAFNMHKKCVPIEVSSR